MPNGQTPGGQPDFSNIFGNIFNRVFKPDAPLAGPRAAVPNFLRNLNVQGPQTNQAFQTLNQILGAQGQTDPQLFNLQLADIARGTQNQQTSARGELAAAGPGAQQSGVGQALMAAIGAGGEERLGRARAVEAATTEERKRRDLDLFMQMILLPALQRHALTIGVKQGSGGILDSILGSVGSALPAGLGFLLGGPPGAAAAGGAFGGFDLGGGRLGF